MIEDAGEIAQLASEYISTLENLPQEVQHIVKEIEHKDAKVQELLPKVAAREAQLRELIGRREAVLSDGDRVKADKLTDKIKADYARADEWSAQKERLSRDLWRNIHAHSKRLEAEIARIAPALVQQVEASLSGTLTPQAQLLPSSTSISSAVLGALRSPSVEASLEIAVPTTGTLKRKFSAASPAIKGARQSSTDRGLPSPSPLSGPAFTPSASTGAGSAAGSGQHKKMKHSSLSVVTKAPPPSSELDIDADGEAAGGEEKDDRVYCHCQRVSFGEMIGCDSDECPYEWFHLTCVGLSKPLPQTWYCTDCRERMEREKSERPTKKRKKQLAAG